MLSGFVVVAVGRSVLAAGLRHFFLLRVHARARLFVAGVGRAFYGAAGGRTRICECGLAALEHSKQRSTHQIKNTGSNEALTRHGLSCSC